MNPSLAIARRFGAASRLYDEHSPVQRQVAKQLAARIHAARLPTMLTALELGCGTGHLTRHLVPTLGGCWIASDLAHPMAKLCGETLSGVQPLVMDGQYPTLAPQSLDLICANLTVQWFNDLPGSLARLTELLRPGGLLAFSTLGLGTFAEWIACYRAENLVPSTLGFLDAESWRDAFPTGGELRHEEEVLLDQPGTALEFLRRLRTIGADTPAPGHRPLTAGELRRVAKRFDATGALVSYRVFYGLWRKP